MRYDCNDTKIGNESGHTCYVYLISSQIVESTKLRSALFYRQSPKVLSQQSATCKLFEERMILHMLDLFRIIQYNTASRQTTFSV